MNGEPAAAAGDSRARPAADEPAAAERAETYLRLLAEDELRQARTGPTETATDHYHRALALVHAGRLPRAASALTALGAIDASAAAATIDRLGAALAVRGHLSMDVLEYPVMRAVRTTRPAPGPPATMQAAPAGRTLRMTGDDGHPVDVYVACLVRTDTTVMISVEARAADSAPAQPLRLPLGAMRITDEQGTSYQEQLSFLGRDLDGRADGWLLIRPAPPAGVRWLELDTGPGTARLRMDASAATAAAQADLEPSAPAEPGERWLESVAGDLLARLPDRRGHGEDMAELVAALEAAGAVPPASPATSRLATLSERAGFDAGAGLVAALAAGRIARTGLPGRWISVLDWFADPRPEDSLRGFAPAGLTLPELDGVRFVILGLTAEPGRMALRVLVFGLPDEYPWTEGRSWAGWFPWWVRDPGGQWHVAAFDGRRTGTGEDTTLELRLVPPLPRPVSHVQVHLTGVTTRMRIGMPVEWVVADG